LALDLHSPVPRNGKEKKMLKGFENLEENAKFWIISSVLSVIIIIMVASTGHVGNSKKAMVSESVNLMTTANTNRDGGNQAKPVQFTFNKVRASID
jgi:hypothetical protein